MSAKPLPFAAPRGLNRMQAAAYVGVSPNTFDKLVEDGAMPRPRSIGRRRVYDRAELDMAFEALPRDDPDADEPNEWDRVL